MEISQTSLIMAIVRPRSNTFNLKVLTSKIKLNDKYTVAFQNLLCLEEKTKKLIIE